MLRTNLDSSLDELWTLTRRAGLRLRAHRTGKTAGGEAVFVLEVADQSGKPVVEVTTKDLESAATWILDQRPRR